MVLEQAFKLNWIEKKEHSFFLGFIYTLIGILSAYFIIPSYAGLMSIAFTSILLIPSLNSLLLQEENVEIREKKLSLGLLLKDHKDIIKVYIFLFMGIFFAYFVTALVLDLSTSSRIFESQLTLTGVLGKAVDKDSLFTAIIVNNFIVFLVCFFLSLIYGAGAILFLTINASAWGIFFGYTLKHVILITKTGKFEAFLGFLIPILPHTTSEALAYVLAAIVGGVVSKAVLREKPFTKKFNHIMTDAVILIFIGMIIVLIAGYIEVYVFRDLADNQIRHIDDDLDSNLIEYGTNGTNINSNQDRVGQATRSAVEPVIQKDVLTGP